MAGAATAAYSSDAWISSSTVDGPQPSQWEYAVPLRRSSTNRTNRRSKSRSSHDSTHARSRRNSKGSRSSSVSRPTYAQDSGYMSSRGRRDPSLHRRGSEKSVRSRSVGNVRESSEVSHGPLTREQMKEGVGLYLDDFDHENWIHRDKLAKIESEELHQAAILFHRRGSDHPRSGRRNHDLHNSAMSVTSARTEHTEPWPNLHDDHGEFIGSPATYHDRTPEEERQNWDLRRPEEIASAVGDDGASSIYRNPGLRKSSSRIPIPTSSPVPVSPEQAGREFNGTRSRGATNGDDESFGMPRRASEPINVDSVDATTPPGSTSRPVSRGFQAQSTSKRTGAKGTPASATRKTSAPPTTRKTTPRSRAVSSNTNQRPTTRSGESRPTTAVNRPEGDPPWLATMYKPDPRLPPDQQMLPTHAKKMQQEQWAKEGCTPTTYDREFAPLAIGPDAPPPGAPPKDEKKEEEPVEVEEKPLPPQSPPPVPAPNTSPKLGEPNTRPGTSTGYSPMPRVQEPPSASLQPRWSPPVVSAPEPPKKEKSCGCCIVM